MVGLGRLTLTTLLTTVSAQACLAQSASRLPPTAKVALALMTAAAAMRVLPELGVVASTFGLHYALAAGLWSASFATWLIGFWPILNDPRRDEGGCG